MYLYFGVLVVVRFEKRCFSIMCCITHYCSENHSVKRQTALSSWFDRRWPSLVVWSVICDSRIQITEKYTRKTWINTQHDKILSGSECTRECICYKCIITCVKINKYLFIDCWYQKLYSILLICLQFILTLWPNMTTQLNTNE